MRAYRCPKCGNELEFETAIEVVDGGEHIGAIPIEQEIYMCPICDKKKEGD